VKGAIMASHTQKGQDPEAGQLTKYVTLQGVKFSKAKINSVGASSPDGEYFNVEVTWVPPGLEPVTETHVYWKELGWVRGDPPGPPYPG
jgi:hypothetical protein